MNALTKSRIIKALITILVFVAFYISNYLYQVAYGQTSFFTGWVLSILMAILLLFNLRKKLSFLPLGSAYTWAQIHIYTGLLMIMLFLVHINKIPNGVFELLLFFIFTILCISGIYGLYISRVLPPRLSNNSEYVIYERIPGLREKIRKEVESLIDEARDTIESKALVDFYEQSLFSFLSKNHDFWGHIMNTTSVYATWNHRFKAVEKYMSENEVLILNKIHSLTLQKIDIDNQFSSRSILKYWLFIHIPLSYILLLLILMHISLTYSFSWSAN